MEKDRQGKLTPKQNYNIIEALNWYSYCSNNPVRYVDPTGEESELFFSRGSYSNSSSMPAFIPKGANPVPDVGAFIVTQDVTVSMGAADPSILNVTIVNTDAIFEEYDIAYTSSVSLKINGKTLYSVTVDHEGALSLLLPVGKTVIGGAFMEVPFDTEHQELSIDVDTTYSINQDSGLWSPGTLETVVELPPDYSKEE